MRNLLIAAALVCGSSPLFAGTYYLTDGDASTAYKVDLSTGTYLGSFPIFSEGYPLAVGATVRIGSRSNVAPGAEYALDGTPTGTIYAGGVNNYDQLLDGTTDGVSFNYAVQCCGGSGVYQSDLAWQNMTPLFSLPTGGSGIAYDTQNGTLWVSTFDSQITEYTLTGLELFSFTAAGTPAALAYDSSSNSFWYFHQGSNVFTNFDRSGNTLADVTVGGLPGNNAWGGEMATAAATATPEPGAWLLALSGLGAVAFWRRRRA